MRVTVLRLFLSLAAILLGTSALKAQTNTPYSYPYSALYVDASQFCANGFNSVLHGCNPPSGGTGANTGMWEAIAAAAASPFNISGVIDARAFQGTQLVTYGVGTTALYGCSGVGACGDAANTSINLVLLLGNNVTNYCEGSGSTAQYYTDGNGSNYGTPCIMVPWGSQIVGTTPRAAQFLPCNGSPCPIGTNFPQRSFGISKISLSGTGNTTMTVTVSSTLNPSGGPLASTPQNIYTGELVAITGAPTPTGFPYNLNVLRVVQSPIGTPNNTFTVSVPYQTGTSGTICQPSGGPTTCGTATAYLVTPLIGFGYQNNNISTGACLTTAPPSPHQYNCAYEPVRVGKNQSFAMRLIDLAFDLGGYEGAVAVQNLNGGEQSGMDTIYCKHVATGCVQVGQGANESGPYDNIYAQTLVPGGAAYTQPATFGIYNGAADAGFHRFSVVLSGTTSEPTAAVYDDGSNVVFDGEPHNEGTVDTIDLAPDNAVAGVTVNGIVGPPCTNAGTNLVHILNDGFTPPPPIISGSTFSALTQQPAVGACGSTPGSVNAVADDIHSNNVVDQFLSRYEFDNGGNPVSGATLQSNTGITIINGSGLTSGGPASATNGSLTLNGSTSGSAAITVSPTGGPWPCRVGRRQPTWS